MSRPKQRKPVTKVDPNRELILKGSKWYSHIYIPREFQTEGKRYITKNLQTDSVLVARKLRDEIKRELFSPEASITLTDYERKLVLDCKQFIRDNQHLDQPDDELEYLYRSLQIDSITDTTERTNKPLSTNQQHKLEVLSGRQSSVCYLRDLLIERKTKLNVSPSVITKVNLAVKWLLGNNTDMDISSVTWKRIDSQLVDATNSTGTLRGYLSYISELWTLAANLEIPVSPTNPAKNHKLLSDKQSYGTLTWDEAKLLYRAASDPRLQQLILVVATSGMRLSEAVSAKIINVDGVPCWDIESGKNDNAIRTFPIHSSIDPNKFPSGWSEIGETYLSTKFTQLVKRVLPSQTHRKLNIHSFRHTVISYLSSLGFNDFQIARISGHGATSSQGAMATYKQGKIHDIELLKQMVESIPNITKR